MRPCAGRPRVGVGALCDEAVDEALGVGADVVSPAHAAVVMAVTKLINARRRELIMRVVRMGSESVITVAPSQRDCRCAWSVEPDLTFMHDA